ncbi:MAG: PH domain-containing protein [Actinobacteria bacterium]|nr:PH domain-containing protein [Actinomycetota bacterium]
MPWNPGQDQRATPWRTRKAQPNTMIKLNYVALVLSWRTEQIAVTDTRLIRVSGILTTTVDIVPLAEITDLSLRCTIPGRILGYGALRIETAGQTRALDRLDFLPHAVHRAMLTGHLNAP